MNQETLEKCAEAVHNAWCDNKIKDGFHSPKDCKWNKIPESEINSVNKFFKWCDMCHPDMYPYAELAENIKDYDRVTARVMLDFVFNESGYIEKIQEEINKCENRIQSIKNDFSGDTCSQEHDEMILNKGIMMGLKLALKEFDIIFGE